MKKVLVICDLIGSGKPGDAFRPSLCDHYAKVPHTRIRCNDPAVLRSLPADKTAVWVVMAEEDLEKLQQDSRYSIQTKPIEVTRSGRIAER